MPCSSLGLSVYLSVCLHVCLSVWHPERATSGDPWVMPGLPPSKKGEINALFVSGSVFLSVSLSVCLAFRKSHLRRSMGDGRTTPK